MCMSCRGAVVGFVVMGCTLTTSCSPPPLVLTSLELGCLVGRDGHANDRLLADDVAFFVKDLLTSGCLSQGVL